ncbi:MAG: helix-turn-helix transcriptional regulator [Rhizobiales bacterium]|nr:helix-turn-helix transcriptional regulator [Hyphomicrobiales bacterium]
MNQTVSPPGMQSDVHGFIVRGGPVWRAWDGVVADVWDVECRPSAGGAYVAPYPRLFVLLDINEGGQLELSAPDIGAVGRHERPFSMSYIPAQMPVESRALGVTGLRHLDLHLAGTALMRKFGGMIAQANLAEARLNFYDPRLAALAGMLAEECVSRQPLNDRCGAGLIDALIAIMFSVGSRTPKARPTLSRAQLDLSLEYMERRCFEPIRLHDLASLLGLSESYFSHAFKASTGAPPLRWQMETRIGKVKELLLREDLTLTDISSMTGFADQAHLTRSFKKVVGVAPSEWRRKRATLQE